MKRDSLLMKSLLFIFTVCIGDITCYIFSCCFEVNKIFLNCVTGIEITLLFIYMYC